MALKTFKPVTPGLRQLVIVDRSQLWKGERAPRSEQLRRQPASHRASVPGRRGMSWLAPVPLVLLLQQKSERKQGWQQNIQGVALFITVLILLIGMYELQTNVINPLQYLTSAAERFRDGDHSARVEFQSEDELGQMAESFNAMADAIEESLRFNTSAQRFKRCLQVDTELHGQTMKAGDFVMLCYGSANRDERMFADADRVDIARDNSEHLTFGYGIHQCLGQMLARYELQVMYRAILARLSGLKLAVPLEEIRFKDDMQIYGIHNLPVTW